jgi:Domain of unknown function (DUF1995)
MRATILFYIARVLLLHLVWRPLSAFSPSVIRCGVTRIRKNGWDNARGFKVKVTALPAQAQNNDSNMNDLRRMLESAWNMDTMGRVPTSAVGAAEASVASLTEALQRRNDKNLPQSSVPRLFFIDILLPQYDIAAGTNLYDEVLAVEFCIALANQLPAGKSEILVRDGKVLRTVTRVLNARDGTSATNSKQSREPKVEIRELPVSAPKTLEPEFFDDFADFESPLKAVANSTDTEASAENTVARDKSIPEDTPPASQSPMLSNDSAGYDTIESFREMLLQSWDATVDLDQIPKDERLEEEEEENPEEPPTHEDVRNASLEKRYRLASFLGEAIISKGADMVDDVMEAVKANALPNDDEETLIMLSVTTKEELYGVRAMVNKYKETKTIVLVNCKLDPLPQELIKAQTVYSILPLIARRAGVAGTKEAAATASPKVVVLRRYPRDWEVYVDIGSGFDLAASVPADGMAMRRSGPSMEWISSAVKRYLQNRVL